MTRAATTVRTSFRATSRISPELTSDQPRAEGKTRECVFDPRCPLRQKAPLSSTLSFVAVSPIFGTLDAAALTADSRRSTKASGARIGGKQNRHQVERSAGSG